MHIRNFTAGLLSIGSLLGAVPGVASQEKPSPVVPAVSEVAASAFPTLPASGPFQPALSLGPARSPVVQLAATGVTTQCVWPWTAGDQGAVLGHSSDGLVVLRTVQKNSAGLMLHELTQWTCPGGIPTPKVIASNPVPAVGAVSTDGQHFAYAFQQENLLTVSVCPVTAPAKGRTARSETPCAQVQAQQAMALETASDSAGPGSAVPGDMGTGSPSPVDASMFQAEQGGKIAAVAFSNGAKQIWVAKFSGAVLGFQLAEGVATPLPVTLTSAGPLFQPDRLAVSPDGKYVAAAARVLTAVGGQPGLNGRLVVWNSANGQLVYDQPIPAYPAAGMLSLRFSDASDRILVLAPNSLAMGDFVAKKALISTAMGATTYADWVQTGSTQAVLLVGGGLRWFSWGPPTAPAKAAAKPTVAPAAPAITIQTWNLAGFVDPVAEAFATAHPIPSPATAENKKRPTRSPDELDKLLLDGP